MKEVYLCKGLLAILVIHNDMARSMPVATGDDGGSPF